MAGGGYRTPSQPAPVSGPGALSQRTDGGQPQRDLPDARYGEGTDYRQQQQGAPLAKAETPSPAPMPMSGPSSSPSAPALNPTPLSAPSSRPDEPVTSGSPLGAGPGPAQNSINMQPGSMRETLAPYIAADSTGVLANLAWTLDERGLW